MKHNFYLINRSKLLFMVEELHRRGYEYLQIEPSLSPSGLSWRCIFFVEGQEKEYIASNWIYEKENGDYSKEITLSIEELADLFTAENPDFLQFCKGENQAYTTWYSKMLNQLDVDELPYAYADWPIPEGIWKTTNDKDIEIFPNEIIFEIAGEGGDISITRVRRTIGDKYIYHHQEIDPSDEGLSINKQNVFYSFEEAFQCINNKYPWHSLYITTVHQDFQNYVADKLIEALNKHAITPDSPWFSPHRLESVLNIQLIPREIEGRTTWRYIEKEE